MSASTSFDVGRFALPAPAADRASSEAAGAASSEVADAGASGIGSAAAAGSTAGAGSAATSAGGAGAAAAGFGALSTAGSAAPSSGSVPAAGSACEPSVCEPSVCEPSVPASSASPVSGRLAVFARFFTAGLEEQPVMVTPTGASIVATIRRTSSCRQRREPATGVGRRGPGRGPPAARSGMATGSFTEPIIGRALGRRLAERTDRPGRNYSEIASFTSWMKCVAREEAVSSDAFFSADFLSAYSNSTSRFMAWLKTPQ